jgi:hypothetical protein
VSLHTVPQPSTRPSDDSRRWSVAVVEKSARAREDEPSRRLVAVFDVFDDLFRRGDRNARRFLDDLATIGRGHAAGQDLLDVERDFSALVETLAREAALTDEASFAPSFRLLLTGAVLKAVRGDHDAALRAKGMATDLVARHTPPEALSTTARPVAAGSWDSLDLDSFDAERPSWH